MNLKTLFVSILFLIPFVAPAQELAIQLDGVKISFVADMQKTTGTVSGLNAKINFNTEDLSKSSITGTASVNTLNTGNKKRDDHLKSDDFFDVEKFPTMSFKSVSFEQKEDQIVMKGIMSIKGIEKEETIIFTFSDNVFKGEGTIQVSNYDLGSFAKKGPEKTNVKISFLIPIQ